MVREAQEHAAEDRRRREEIDARNELDALAYRVEQLLGELGDRLPVNERARAEQMVADARQAIADQAGLDRVRPLISDLQQLVQGLPASAAAAAGAGAGAGAGTSGDGNGGRPAGEERLTTRWSMQSSPGNDGGDQGRAHDEQAVAEQPGAEQAELARMEDRYKRALADLDNYRKRASREVERRLAEGTEALLRDWLEVVDSIERALRMEHGETPAFQGLRAVLDQMEAILARHGVARIGEAGERFDPERHEAIAVRASEEVPDQTVLEVARSGWALRDRVLRPAQVVVSRRGQRET